MANLSLDLPDRSDFQKWFQEAVYNWMSDLEKQKKLDVEKINHEIKYLTISEMSTRLHVSKVTLNKLDREGLPSFKVGKRRLYDPLLVQKFLDERNAK